jgi:MarR family transcriptional regulator, organic hydroperoxide resistance regulator
MTAPRLPRSPSDGDVLLDLDNQVCFALYSASRLVVREYRSALDELDLTYPQYLVMLVLWEWARLANERSTVSALGDRLDLDSGTLTPLLRRLEEKGLVTRNRSGSDEREVFVKLTSAGLKLKEPARRVPLTLLQKAPMPIGELLALRDQLNRLRAGLAASNP